MAEPGHQPRLERAASDPPKPFGASLWLGGSQRFCKVHLEAWSLVSIKCARKKGHSLVPWFDRRETVEPRRTRSSQPTIIHPRSSRQHGCDSPRSQASGCRSVENPTPLPSRRTGVFLFCFRRHFVGPVGFFVPARRACQFVGTPFSNRYANTSLVCAASVPHVRISLHVIDLRPLRIRQSFVRPAGGFEMLPRCRAAAD